MNGKYAVAYWCEEETDLCLRVVEAPTSLAAACQVLRETMDLSYFFGDVALEAIRGVQELQSHLFECSVYLEVESAL